MTEITLSGGHPVPLKPASVKKFRGMRLPGANLVQAGEKDYTISIHEYSQKLFRYSLRSLNCLSQQTFTVVESSKYLRIETVLAGEFSILEDGVETRLLPGQYRITGSKYFQVHFEASHGCQYFVAFLSPQLLEQTPLSDAIVPGGPFLMSPPMRDVIYRITDNPFEEKFRDAFYDYTIRELLFYHVSSPPFAMPGEMTQAEIAAVYEADKIITSNLNVHYPTSVLARMVRTNVHVLKTGFPKIFGLAPFERLIQRKMERAKYLLETTDKQVQDIAELAGYETVTGFINAFRRQFKITPKDWRKKSRGLL